MPSLDFRCTRCQTVFEARRAAASPNPACPACGGAVEAVFLVAPAFHGFAAAGRNAAAGSLPACGKGCRCCP